MIPAAIALILFLLLMYLYEKRRSRALRRQLRYISEKLNELACRPMASNERVQLITDQPELRELLRSVNQWLDLAGKSASDYAMTEQAMRKMLSNVSHDLKTPLTVVLGYAEMLERNPDAEPEERRRLLGQVRRKTLEVLELMNAFFDLARLESNDTELPLALLDAGELARRRLLEYYDLLAADRYEVELDIPDRPLMVYANEEALTRILDNLLSNAVRYGAAGRYLGLKMEERDSYVLIEVADRGPGIPLPDQPRVFERLYTLEDSRNRNVQGSGLGLTITKRLVEKLGGSISLQSVPHIRTSFTVSLKRAGFGDDERK
ncbi:sensor histidine kinase [Paenibacillus nanensis]|uniref:histidine kinase n=1 Tax=Paenibacillus nanensis TaxID=393251 RepID=A0A3A1ULP0_9BACL|nr:sensor histidine kinase [Paenibacillus nanensis]RIX48602.1 sensor histidine kinase [Paenibacillus nanensis]